MLKKQTYILLSLLLCIPILFIIYFAFTINTEAPVDSTDITVRTADGYDFSFNEAEDLSVYSLAVRNAAKVSEAPDISAPGAIPTVVTYTDTEGQYSHDYYMTLDPDKCYYANAQGDFFRFKDDDAKILIERPEFSYLYPNYTVPSLTLSIGGKDFAASVDEYEWSFKRAGEFVEGLPAKTPEKETIYFDKDDSFSLGFSQDPDTCEINVLKGNSTIHTASWESFAGDSDNVSDALISQLYEKINDTNDTPLVCEIKASWEQIDSSTYYGEATYRTDLIFDVPVTCQKVDPRLSPGEFTFIKLNNLNENQTVTFISDSEDLPLPETRTHKIGDMTFAYFPADLAAKPGTYKIKAITDDSETEFSIIISPPKETKKSTTVKTIHGMAGYDASKLELEALVKTITAQSAEKHLWEDAEVENTSSKYTKKYQFKKPVNSTYSADIGTKITEDPNLLASTPYVKTSIFFEAEKGTDVIATASGKVAHVGNTAYSGNFIIIDHGFGLLSIYENLSEVLVQSGDEVEMDDLIGKTGDAECGYTFKSGMRFSMSMEGTFINPVSNFSGISY